MKSMTSKERVCAALKRQEVDYVPCSPFFNQQSSKLRVGYKWQWPFGPSGEELAEYCVKKLNIDPFIYIFSRQIFPEETVSVKTWLEGEVIHKKYHTPSGVLSASVRYDEKWPFGLDIPFIMILLHTI